MSSMLQMQPSESIISIYPNEKLPVSFSFDLLHFLNITTVWLLLLQSNILSMITKMFNNESKQHRTNYYRKIAAEAVPIVESYTKTEYFIKKAAC